MENVNTRELRHAELNEGLVERFKMALRDYEEHLAQAEEEASKSDGEGHRPKIGDLESAFRRVGDRMVVVASDGERVFRIDLKRQRHQTSGAFYVDECEKFSVTTRNFELARKLCVKGAKVYFGMCAKRNRHKKARKLRARAEARAAFGELANPPFTKTVG